MRIAIALALTVLSGTAMAQTEAEKRRAHLPFVRAATDCIADAIRQNSAALDALLAGRWEDARRTGVHSCIPQLDRMVTAHNQIYGGGGMEFATGPYANDLQRALTARLRNDLERRAAFVAERDRREREAAERQQRAAREQQEARITVIAEALKTYRDCITNEALALIPFSNENADTIASVSDTKCAQSRDRVGVTVQAVMNTPPAESRSFASELIAEERKKLVASVVTLRAAAVAGRSGGTSAPASPATPVVPASPPGRAF